MIRRRLFAVASAISLLLCLAVVALWVRGYWSIDRTQWSTHDARAYLSVKNEFGSVRILGQKEIGKERFYGVSPGISFSTSPAEGEDDSTPGYANIWIDDFGLFVWTGSGATANNAPLDRSFLVIVPDWLIILPGAVFLFVGWRIRRNRRCREKMTLCSRCSYNLTGNTSGTCPECGTPVPQPAKS